MTNHREFRNGLYVSFNKAEINGLYVSFNKAEINDVITDMLKPRRF